MPIDEQTLESLKAKHGSVLHLKFFDPNDEREEKDRTPAAEIVVKRPSRAAYKRWRSMIVDDAKKADAVETLMKDAVVHPTLPEWEAMLDEYPALPETFGGEVLKLLGANTKADAKKY